MKMNNTEKENMDKYDPVHLELIVPDGHGANIVCRRRKRPAGSVLQMGAGADR